MQEFDLLSFYIKLKRKSTMMIRLNLLLKIINVICMIVNIVYATEIYHKNNSGVYFTGHIAGLHFIAKNNNDDIDQTNVHLTFKGETQISNQLVSYSQWEYSQQNNNNTSLAYIGIKSNNYGSLDYGYNYSVIRDILTETYLLSEYGSIYSKSSFMNLIKGITTYRNNNFFGLVNRLHFSIQYFNKNLYNKNYVVHTDKFINIANMNDTNGRGWTTSLNYKLGCFSFMSAYGSINYHNILKITQQEKSKNKAEQWITGLKYNKKNIYLAASYGEARNIIPVIGGFINKTQDTLLAAQYRFDFGLRPSITYIQSKAIHIKDLGNVNLVKYLKINIAQLWNENVSTYVNYKINRIDHNNKLGIHENDTIALGVLYRF